MRFVALWGAVAFITAATGPPVASAETVSNPPSGVFLALPDASLAPAIPNNDFIGTISSAAADQSYFAEFHTTQYRGAGRVTGFYERADWSDSTSAVVTIRYQANYFDSPTEADASWVDENAATSVGTSGTFSSCPVGEGIACHQYVLVARGDVIRFNNVQVGACTAELASETTAGTDAALAPRIMSLLLSATQSAARVMQSACVGTRIGINSVDLTRTSDANAPSTSSPAVKHSGLIAVHWNVSSNDAATLDVPTYTISVARKGYRTLTSAFAGTVQAYAPGQYGASFKVVLPDSGVYRVRVTIRYHGDQKTLTGALKATS